VVGDDDQSLYRFRGATVELFKDYPGRLQKNLARTAKVVFLTRNYRSTKQIVEFVADYGELDRKFQQVRVRNKPRIAAYRSVKSNLPVVRISATILRLWRVILHGFWAIFFEVKEHTSTINLLNAE
jgi:DNA helicase II / ATP-dependent DNA helicase PcrA